MNGQKIIDGLKEAVDYSKTQHRMLSLTKPQLEAIARALRCPCSVEPDTHLLGRVETAIASFGT